MAELKNRYPEIRGRLSVYYGGSQSLSDSEQIKRCGCGIISAADLIIYLRSAGRKTAPLSLEKYNKFLKFLNRHYFPLIPGLGMNALGLMSGINLYFKNKGLPYKALWLGSGEKLFARIEEQLDNDIPVIMSAGPNFPLIWQKHRLNLYEKSAGAYIKTCSVKAHFFTATGIDSDYIRISSWGRELYIDKAEFMSYMKKYSTSFLCNMLQIKKR